MTANRLDPRISLLCLLLWGALLFHGWGGLATDDPASLLHSPSSTAARMSARALDLADAIEASSERERRFWRHLESTPDEALSNAIAIHEDLIASLERASADEGAAEAAWSELDATRITLAVLLAEWGAWDEGCSVAIEVDDIGDLCGLLLALYADGEAPEDPPELQSLFDFLEDWPADRLRLRAAWAAGDEPGAQAALAAARTRGRRLLDGTRGLFVVNWSLVALGLVIAIVWLLRREVPAAARADGPAWSVADGLGVLVRGDLASRAYLVALGELPPGFAASPAGLALWDFATPLSSLPLLYLVTRHLVLPHLAAQPDPFGIDPRRIAWRSASAFALVAIAVELLGTQSIGWGSFWLEAESPWTEGFDETLVWGTPLEVSLLSLDYVFWVPALEELAFRGLLFFSLRKRMGVLAATLLSAATFSAVHFYSLTGFLTTLFGGVVWALVFERTRSLVPGIAAHAVYNAFFVAGLLLLYR